LKYTKKKNLGIVGLGSMGEAMLKNLLRKNYIVYGHDINSNVKKRLKNIKSFYFCESLKELCQNVKEILIVVENQNQSEKIIKKIINYKKNKILDKNFLVICCVTVSSTWVEKSEKLLSKYKIKLIDSPMSGGPKAALKGNLSLMVSGKKNALKLGKKILKDLSKKQFIIGFKAGYGSKMKMVNQCLAGIHISAAAEAIVLAKREKLNLDKVLDVIKSSAGASWMFNDRGPRMIKKNFSPPKSRINIFVKDMKIVRDVMKKHKINLPLSKASLQNYQKAKLKKMQNLDDSSLVSLLDKTH